MTDRDAHDYLVLGAGPAGLQLGYLLGRAGMDYRILEAGDRPGAFFERFPRHRKLISINKIHNGYDDPEIDLRWDWNSLLCDEESLLFKHYSQDYFPAAADLSRYLGDFAARCRLDVRYGTRVRSIHRDGSLFHLEDEEQTVHRCHRLVVATGVSKPYIPEIPGIELAESYNSISVDPRDFVNQWVLIIGKGNSGFETADNLIPTAARIHLISPKPLRMAWKTHFVGDLRAVNNNLLDTYQLKSQNAVIDGTILKMERRGDRIAVLISYAHADDEVEEILYDRVIACTGFRFDDSIFDQTCKPEMSIDGRLPCQTSEWESVNVPGLHFAGTLMQMRDYKKTTSGFIHGFRYNVRALQRILAGKYHAVSWPQETLAAEAGTLTEHALGRINRSSALWQQFGFLCDVLIVDDERQVARYLEELPVDYVHDGEIGRELHYYTVTLEYGVDHQFPDPFNVTRIRRDDIARADRSNFLHPIVRRFRGSELLAEHHVIEDFAAEWKEPEHIEPLRDFFKSSLAGPLPRHASSLAAGNLGRTVGPPPQG